MSNNVVSHMYSFEENRVSSAAIAMFHWSIGKGMKAIMDKICEKLGVSSVKINQLERTPLIAEELDDFSELHYLGLKSNDVRYIIEGNCLTEEEWFDWWGAQLAVDKEKTLNSEIELFGISGKEFYSMMDKSRTICRKYDSQP